MEIVKQYCVDGQCFNTREEAEAYVENNEDLRQIRDFVEYKRANGAARVNAAVIEEYIAWVKAGCPKGGAAAEEEAEETPAEPEVDQTPAEATEETSETESQEEEDQPPFPVDPVDETQDEAEAPAEAEPEKKISTSLFG